ncbi:MAG: hypothetical protein C5S38_06660 [Candidatus Methanophagaceae archaeon]|nr:MAG: hypothetical protein C5S38_06660 [Methanophagales archaeon]
MISGLRSATNAKKSFKTFLSSPTRNSSSDITNNFAFTSFPAWYATDMIIMGSLFGDGIPTEAAISQSNDIILSSGKSLSAIFLYDTFEARIAVSA